MKTYKIWFWAGYNKIQHWIEIEAKYPKDAVKRGEKYHGEHEGDFANMHYYPPYRVYEKGKPDKLVKTFKS